MKRLSFLELEKEMSLLSEQEMSKTLGGNGGGDDPSWDCVLNCFDYIDDGVMNGYNAYYSGGEIYNGEDQPYNPQKAGGIRSQDFATVAFNGGLNIVELGNAVSITASGRTLDGYKIMITIPGAGGEDHAVVVTGTYIDNNGKGQIQYFDPTTGKSFHVASSGENISGFYAFTTMPPLPTTTIPTTTIG